MHQRFSRAMAGIPVSAAAYASGQLLKYAVPRASPDNLAGKLSALLQVLHDRARTRTRHRLPRLQEHSAGARGDHSCDGYG